MGWDVGLSWGRCWQVQTEARSFQKAKTVRVGWLGPALASGAQSPGQGQGLHTSPARSQRMNSLGFPGHVVSAATTQFCPRSTRAAKDNTEMNRQAVSQKILFINSQWPHLAHGWAAVCRPLGSRGEGETGKIRRVQTKQTGPGRSCYCSHFIDENVVTK